MMMDTVDSGTAWRRCESPNAASTASQKIDRKQSKTKVNKNIVLWIVEQQRSCAPPFNHLNSPDRREQMTCHTIRTNRVSRLNATANANAIVL